MSLILAFAMILAIVPMSALTASAETSGYYTYEVSNGEATITDVDTSISGSITIPSTLGGYPVTIIDNEAFCGCSSLTSVTIPNSVTSINDSAFYDCYGLSSVTIPKSINSIGNEALGYYENGDTYESEKIPDFTITGANGSVAEEYA